MKAQRHLSKKSRGKTLKAKILFYMSMTVAISLLVLGIASVYLNYTSSIDMLEQTMKETALIAAERVEQELLAYKNVAIDAGAIARLADPEQTAEAKKEIVDQRAADHGFVRGNIIWKDGISIFDGKDYSDREYFQQALKGNAYVSEPLISKITGELSIMIAAPLWKGGIPKTEVVGVIYFVPKETFLNDIVSQIKISENGTSYAINANGTTIADNTLETIMTQNIEEEAKSDSSLKELASIHARMRNQENGFAGYKVNGVRKFTSFAPIAGTAGWSMAVTAPQSDFMDSTYTSIAITIVILIAGVMIAAIIAFKMAKEIGGAASLCANRLKELSQGDLKADVPQIARDDELGVLAEATGTIVSTISGIIDDIDNALGEIASGNLSVASKAKELYVGDFKSLYDSLQKIVTDLTSTLQQVRQSADQVSAGSDQVSSASQALSQGATEQASSVEELAATINEISAHVNQTASNAKAAREKTEETGAAVEASNNQMQDMISAMDVISDKAAEIKKVIKTIEDIAFQTNILALNAAVEAARAGAAGKGFAVVADEVRNLASKSAEASKGTASLIDGTVDAVEHGTKIAHDTAESLVHVLESTTETVEMVVEISNAANEQASSIAQVTQGIDQISSVVQTNSATSEESAAASEELSGQAQILKGLMAQFKLRTSEKAEKASQDTQTYSPKTDFTTNSGEKY